VTRKKRRLVLVAVVLALTSTAVGLILWGLSGSISFFNSPSDLVARPTSPNTRVRLGGLVQEGSIERLADQVVMFTVTDGQTTIRVRYQGILPDLFRERQGVVAEGRLVEAGLFRADSVLARHDENYMPREVVDALRRAGHFLPGEERAANPDQHPAAATPAAQPGRGGGS
jgi:cytochrome c-type biogenesis protein CcmE